MVSWRTQGAEGIFRRTRNDTIDRRENPPDRPKRNFKRMFGNRGVPRGKFARTQSDFMLNGLEVPRRMNEADFRLGGVARRNPEETW